MMRCIVITISRSKRNHILTKLLSFHALKTNDKVLPKLLGCKTFTQQTELCKSSLNHCMICSPQILTHPTPITAWILAITNNYRLRLHSSCRRKTRCITKCLSANNEQLESVFWIRSLCVSVVFLSFYTLYALQP